MIPGMNPRQMAQAMKKLGIKTQDIDADLVIIKTATTEIIIQNPQVQKMDMMGQETYQIVGKAVERPLETFEVSPEDIKLVMEQAKVTEDMAKDVLQKFKGDIAAAIMELKK